MVLMAAGGGDIYNSSNNKNKVIKNKTVRLKKMGPMMPLYRMVVRIK